MSKGEKNLDILLQFMNPVLDVGVYVFCSVSECEAKDASIQPRMSFVEQEGITWILEKKQADSSRFEYASEWALITLSVHSSLNAVGFLARVCSLLASKNISVNAVSAFYHDHLFVPFDRANEALELLSQELMP